ncbi:MAG: Rpn family recombination-promoting nuclease/putative transposase, partial [Clostridia bacterium]|nr:Rpn family recombination-promoting nuclease/putative transposase [Clostridia bacterium]
LKPCYVIFICTFDPFEDNLYRYSFENLCLENPSRRLNDESYKLFFNTRGTNGEISESLKDILFYMNDPKKYPVEQTKTILIKKIERAVEVAKKDEEWRRAYMFQQLRDWDMQKLGEKRGLRQGREEGIQLSKKAIAKNMLADGMPVEKIVYLTGLSLNEVRKMQ